MNILLIDDEADILELLADLLQMYGANVDCAYSGESGVEKLKSNTYDAVVTDVKMASGDGMFVVDNINELNLDLKKLIVMTGYTAYPIEEFFKKGVDKVLQKPVDDADLRVYLGL